ncbi:MAG TPA: Gmad2 immunoglobulin-like domain-containing protein [Rubrobacteraceae bacterium]|nr:Gmad2 immunoglobulin-like domain-containing protein [Rubrobacteraceae bacterium]
MIRNLSGRGWLASLAVLALAMLMAGAAPAQATVPDTIQNVRFGDHTTFERAVIDLGHGGVPGQVAPTFSSSYRQGDWIVRVDLLSVTATARTDGSGLGRAISKYYVVRSRSSTGNMFVDFHLTGAAKSVNVFKLDNPARIVVDVTPGGTTLFPRPVTGASTVVTRPRTDMLVGPDTFIVSGYGRPFEASGVWRIKNASGTVVRRGTYTTSDWAATWGAYKFSAGYPSSLSGHSGTLQVGELSPKDGSFMGVSVPLRFR